jgi:adenosine deaminase
VTERDLVALPKTDLHVHLEGSRRATTVVELAERYGVALPPSLQDGRYTFVDFPDFIRQWLVGQDTLRRPEDFHRIALEFCEDEAAQGVRYAEVHFSLPEHVHKVGSWDSPLEAVLDGFAEGEARFGVLCRVIVDACRGLGMDLSTHAMEAAARHVDGGVVGLGLGGSEVYAPGPYAPLFREARQRGLHSIPHAGENEGPRSIREAIEKLQAERIGHGIRIMEDAALVDEVRERGIPLDVCPTSNLMTRVAGSLAEHPLPRMLEAGLTVTLNSDDPAMFDSPVAGEYEICRRVFGMDDARLASLARSGVRASFAPDLVKSGLERAIDAWLGEPAGEAEPPGSRSRGSSDQSRAHP